MHRMKEKGVTFVHHPECKKTGKINIMQEEKVIIEKLTELLFQEKLITLEEKAGAARLLREAEAK